MILDTLSPFVLWVVEHTPIAVQNQLPCLSYYGSSIGSAKFFYGTTDPHCAARVHAQWPADHPFQLKDHNRTQFVWIEQNLDSVDPFLHEATEEKYWSRWSHVQEGQVVLGDGIRRAEVLHENEESVLIGLDRSLLPSIDSHVPRFWEMFVLPDEPISPVVISNASLEKIRELVASAKHDSAISKIVDDLSIAEIRRDIRFLTGENPESPIVSRHTFSKGVRLAGQWIVEHVEATGATCELHPFLNGWAPNIACTYPSIGNTSETVVVGAHYDSRGTPGSDRAPGGNDDGSGLVALLALARTIYRKEITFAKTVRFLFFAGEEQGMIGSMYYARYARRKGDDILLMLEADTLAYHAPGEPSQLGLPLFIGTAVVTQLVAKMAAIYSPELQVGYTGICCSDHQRFIEQGYPATHLFERAGTPADPMIHNSGDFSERPGYDFEQLKSIAQVLFASLLHAAEFEVDESAM